MEFSFIVRKIGDRQADRRIGSRMAGRGEPDRESCRIQYYDLHVDGDHGTLWGCPLLRQINRAIYHCSSSLNVEGNEKLRIKVP